MLCFWLMAFCQWQSHSEILLAALERLLMFGWLCLSLGPGWFFRGKRAQCSSLKCRTCCFPPHTTLAKSDLPTHPLYGNPYPGTDCSRKVGVHCKWEKAIVYLFCACHSLTPGIHFKRNFLHQS